jgi:catalase (peroxidase I)
MMLNADVSLLTDGNYTALVDEFAANRSHLDVDFSAAWYKLTTRDMGPKKRCFPSNANYPVPPSQPWQFDLPATPAASSLPDFAAVKADLKKLLTSTDHPDVAADMMGTKKNYGALFAQLAWQCASTFRQTDNRGGCNGARIRFAPENMWADNVALNTTSLLTMFTAVRAKYTMLSWADTIVLAGHVAVEEAGGFKMDFCGGRTDAADGSGSANLDPINWTNKATEFNERAFRLGLTPEELMALMAIPRTNARGPWQSSGDPSALGTGYFAQVVGTNATNMSPMDLAIRNDAALKALAQGFVTNPAKLKQLFPVAWNKVMNADFFIGWNGLTCPKALRVGPYSSGASITLGFVALIVPVLFL